MLKKLEVAALSVALAVLRQVQRVAVWLDQRSRWFIIQAAFASSILALAIKFGMELVWLETLSEWPWFVFLAFWVAICLSTWFLISKWRALFIAAAVAGSLFLTLHGLPWAVNGAFYVATDSYVPIEVTKTEINGEQQRVWGRRLDSADADDVETFRVEDFKWLWGTAYYHLTSPDTYGQLREGARYCVRTVGVRQPRWSWFRNIFEVHPGADDRCA